MFDESLVTSDVCIRCGACCSVYVRKGTTEVVGYEEVASGDDVEVIACPHLRIENELYLCGNYENRPDVCRQYSCLSQANVKGLDMADGQVLASRVRSTVRQVLGREIELVVID